MDLEKRSSELYDFGNNIDRNCKEENERLYSHIDSRVDKNYKYYERNTYQKIYRQLDENNNSVING